jgi:hypothetical protein
MQIPHSSSRYAIALAAAWATLSPIACGGPSSSPPATIVTTTIGPSGGQVATSGATLDIPAGALTTPTAITITEERSGPPAPYVGLSALFQFSPEGLTFAKPATVSFSTSASAANGSVFWSLSSGPGYQALPTTWSGTSALAPITHFSSGFVGEAGEDHEPADAAANTPDGASPADAAVTGAASPDATVGDGGGPANAADGASPGDATLTDAASPDATVGDGGGPESSIDDAEIADAGDANLAADSGAPAGDNFYDTTLTFSGTVTGEVPDAATRILVDILESVHPWAVPSGNVSTCESATDVDSTAGSTIIPLTATTYSIAVSVSASSPDAVPPDGGPPVCGEGFMVGAYGINDQFETVGPESLVACGHLGSPGAGEAEAYYQGPTLTSTSITCNIVLP